MAATISYETLSPFAGGFPTQSSYSRNGLGIGTAAGNRTVLIASFATSQTDRTLSSITLGGNTPDLVETVIGTPNGAGFALILHLHRIDVASGTTADLAVTYSDTVLDYGCFIAAAYGIASSTFDTTTGGTNSPTLDLNTSAGGIAIGFTAMFDTGLTNPTLSWSGLTERADDNVNYTTTAAGWADLETASASTPLAVSVTHPTASGSDVSYSAISASFAEAAAAGTILPGMMQQYYG